MKVLIHSCCAPCTTFPLMMLRTMGYEVDGLFLNPNIYPEEEYQKRFQVYGDWGNSVGLKTREVLFDHDLWLKAVGAKGYEKPFRCEACYFFRMLRVAQEAKRDGYDAFSTSLLVSPYQDHEALRRAMEKASILVGVSWLKNDFRPGYRRSREMARGCHLYMQKYCGCEFSQRGE